MTEPTMPLEGGSWGAILLLPGPFDGTRKHSCTQQFGAWCRMRMQVWPAWGVSAVCMSLCIYNEISPALHCTI